MGSNIDIKLSTGVLNMKINRLYHVLLMLVLLACSSGVQGQYNSSTVMLSSQYNTTTAGYPTAAPTSTPTAVPYATQSAALATAQYAQFYTMNSGPIPSSLVSVPQPYAIAGNMPATVYFSNQMQSVPFSQYQANPTSSASNSLWIRGSTAWSQYAAVPVGANISLLAISPMGGGSGALNIMGSNGQTYNYNYFFYPSNLLYFNAIAPGRYTLSFAIGGAASNPVVIDVAGTMTMTYNPTANNPTISNPIVNYSPAINSYSNPQAALDIADANKAYQKMYGSDYENFWRYYVYSWLNAP